MSKLALLGGEKAVTIDAPEDMFHWPIINQKMKDAIVNVLIDGNMSGLDISKKFEAGFAKWHGIKYALAHSSGTAAIKKACANYSDLLPGDTDSDDVKDSWNLTKCKE